MKAAILLAATVAAFPLAPAAIAGGQPEARQFVINNEEVGVPVFPYDITDRPYKVLGEVKAGVRKATIFSKAPSQEKIYHELWERGEKLGADAVIKAQYGDARVTALSWGESSATGVAIKFIEPAPLSEEAVPGAIAPAATTDAVAEVVPSPASE